MRTLILKNSEWYRGIDVESKLLREDGRRCCLGIDAKARRIPDELLINAGIPSQVSYYADRRINSQISDEVVEFVRKYVEDWTDQEYVIAQINDRNPLSDEERVNLLRPFFAKRNIELVFDPEA